MTRASLLALCAKSRLRASERPNIMHALKAITVQAHAGVWHIGLPVMFPHLPFITNAGMKHRGSRLDWMWRRGHSLFSCGLFVGRDHPASWILPFTISIYKAFNLFISLYNIPTILIETKYRVALSFFNP